MVQSEQRGPTRREGPCGWRARGSARRNGFGALAVVALLVVMVTVSATGCGSNTQASASTTASVTVAGQTGFGQSLPSGPPSGNPPSGAPIASTSSTDTAGVTATTTVTAAESTTTTEAPTTTTSLASGQHGDGIYEAGVDISTGLYRGTITGTKAHWEISSDANGDKYVASGDPTGGFYVKVTYGQYLRLNGVIIETAGSTVADPLATSNLTDGTYRVGYDIAVGWYKGTVNDGMGYWQISSDANGQTLVANDYPLGSFKLKVTSGQFLTLRGVTVSQ
jgi:hypothetical protein